MLLLSAALDYSRGAWRAYAHIALFEFGFGFANERQHVQASRHQLFSRTVTWQRKIVSQVKAEHARFIRMLNISFLKLGREFLAKERLSASLV